jgi:2-oxoglutarate dehydrogenase E2 component (dihydrolipoamide succinyltransferase)
MVRIRAIFVFSALFALPVLADEAPPSPTATAEAPAKPKAVKKPAAGPAGAANMIVTKDAETGELRPATPAEREKLLGRQPLAAPAHEAITLPDGTVMVELGEADRSYAVATRNPDGSVSRTCVHGAAEAAKAAASPAPAAAPPPAPKTDR